MTMFGSLGTGEIILIILVILLLFGAKKIPEMMRGLGTGMREFKRATREATDEFGRLTSVEPESEPTPASPVETATVPPPVGASPTGPAPATGTEPAEESTGDSQRNSGPE